MEAFGDRVTAVNTASERGLYKARQAIYPKTVHGIFRRLKWQFMAVLLGIYYITPWLRWDRGPGAPDQGVLIDFPSRRFYFFFIEIWPQEIYVLAGLLILGALGLFLATSLFGRVWCGYGCPQTVWTDLFLKVEEWIEGDRAARIRLDKAPWSASKFRKRALKHAAWIVIGFATGGAWIFYFADAPTLAMGFVTGSAPLVAYGTVAFFTASTYVMAGHLREQVCTYMCPYARFQGAMMDEYTYTVTYRLDRGEPRGVYRKGQSFAGRGDCIDCTQCVAACPAGIDIRDGQQMECIACGLCIDACDDVMEKIGRPRGLISYDNLANLARRNAGQPEKHALLRLRTLVYAALVMLIAAGLTAALMTRSDLELNVIHDRDPLFTRLADGAIRNGYTVKILNKGHQERHFRLGVSGLDDGQLSIVGETLNVNGGIGVTVPADQLRAYKVYVRQPAGAVSAATTRFDFMVSDLGSSETVGKTSMFEGPH
jgi:cytochrome c oxidase accessory protein FixG